MSDDPEIAAMRAVSEALEPLDVAAQKRVLDWAADRFGTVGELVKSLAAAAGEARRERDALKSQIDAMTNAKPCVEVSS